MEPRLLSVLRQVRSGINTFEPADTSEEAAKQFQATAKAVIHAHAMGYIHNVRPLVTAMRGSHFYKAVLTRGGLTYEGEQALAGEIDHDDVLQGMVDEILQTDQRRILRDHWERAILRSRHDPPGAITAANSFLEAVLKWIVSQRGLEPPENRKKLFEMAVAEIGRSRDGASLDTITGHVDTLLRELGALRSKIGDAHGASGAHPTPTPTLALFSINLAATLALYLLDTYEELGHPE